MVETRAATHVDAQPVSSRPSRGHDIVLCCARSVQALVEEVARNLSGMGFPTEVVCGAAARDALLTRNAGLGRPTIYVICVQGALKETVLKPLRQALARRGGPNAYLFVAVLDVSLPLSMVGQIRRFAETLERPVVNVEPARTDVLSERRAWRAQMGQHQRRRYVTRSQRAARVIERARARQGTERPRTGPLRLESERKPARLVTSGKYRAVTGPLPPLTVHRRTSQRTIRRQVAVPLVSTRSIPEPAAVEKKVAVAESSPVAVRRRSATPIWIVGGLAVLAAGLWWISSSPESTAPVVAQEGSRVDAAEPPADADRRHTEDEETLAAAAKHSSDEPDEASTDEQPADEREGETDGEPASVAASDPQAALLDRDNAALAAIARRSSLRDTDTMFVSPPQGETTTWARAKSRCEDYEVEGITGWRLPFQREIKLLGAIGAIRGGSFWSRSVDKSDPDFAFVYDTDRKELVTWLKAEPNARPVCIRRKEPL